MFEILDPAKAGTYERCWHQATERLDRSPALELAGDFLMKLFCQNRNLFVETYPHLNSLSSPGTTFPMLT